jgi:hypothetical protein
VLSGDHRRLGPKGSGPHRWSRLDDHAALISTDEVIGTRRSGKHDNHRGNVQVVTAPDGWPLWTSNVRPGREHDTTALREHGDVLPLLTTWTSDDLRVLGDLGYEGEADTITVAHKKP